MKIKVKLRWLALLCAGLCSAQAVRADSIAVLTSGSFVVGEMGNTYGGTFSGLLNGTTPFEVTSFGSDATGVVFPCIVCGPAGDHVNLGGAATDSAFRMASATIDGINYNLCCDEGSIGLALFFNAGDIILPDPGTPGSVFSFEGTYNLDGSGANVPALNNESIILTGQGRVRMLLQSDSDGAFALQSVTYTATAVPEPATMVLLGTGLAGISAAVRKRRRAGKGEQS